MKQTIGEFRHERERLNRIVMKHSGASVKRFFSLDGQVYRDGALPARTKELLGLTASLALRCDDCVRYHVDRCFEAQVSDAEFGEALAVGLVVGGSITIPHLRRAFEFWDDLRSQKEET